MTVTAIIAIVLAVWALYAFSGAGVIRQLPLVKPILMIVSVVFIMRGVLGIPMVSYMDHPYAIELKEKMTFMILSSVISLGLGLFYLMGTLQIERSKSNKSEAQSG